MRLKRWLRGSRPPEPPSEDAWRGAVAALGLDRVYDDETLERLRTLTIEFLAVKEIRGAGGLEVDDTMRLTIALQASVPILELGLDWYRGWVTVLVYPDEFLVPVEYEDEAGVVHAGDEVRIGEAWPDGPVILSWHDSSRGNDDGAPYNVVIHEFAHKLDQLYGDANGRPPLHPEMNPEAWTEAFQAAYDDFVWRTERDGPLPLDEYAAEDPGEFFAVASEGFFVDPRPLRAFYPAVYRQLARFYRQDLLARRR
jgi:hypothetical protein